MAVKKSLLFFVLILFVQLNAKEATKDAKDVGKDVESDPDEDRDAVELIESHGFNAETHYVTTEDGYILAVHRIVQKQRRPQGPNGPRKPILLQHGLLSSSVDWLINSPTDEPEWFDLNRYDIDGRQELDFEIDFGQNFKNSVSNNLGFALAKQGYDVWLSNSRGNTYSANHTKFNPKEKVFWQFTFDELVKYDLPAVISLVLNQTNQTELGYIGHSQGTAIMFGLLATKPEYNDIVKPFIALAPVASVGHVESPIRYFAFLRQVLIREGGSFLPSNYLVRYLADHICKEEETRWVCSNIVFLLCGFDAKQLNMTRLPVYFSHTPAGTSSWNIAHFAQMVISRKFCMFDFGHKNNLIHYGQPTPPLYPLENITSPNIALIYGENDFLADPVDVAWLKTQLKVPLLLDYLVPDPKWSHLDFLIGKDAGKLVNAKIIELLAKVF